MKYKIFFKDKEIIECETLTKCRNCIETMMNALEDAYTKDDFKIYQQLDQEQLGYFQKIENDELASSILVKFFEEEQVYVDLYNRSLLIDGTITLTKEEEMFLKRKFENE